MQEARNSIDVHELENNGNIFKSTIGPNAADSFVATAISLLRWPQTKL